MSATHSVAAAWASDGDGQLEYVPCFVRVPLGVAPILCFLHFLIGRLVDDRRIHLCTEIFCVVNEMLEPSLVPVGNAVPVFDFLSVQLLGYQCIRCRGKSEECISVIYTVYMESGKKLLGYAREIAYFSKTVAKERNTAQRFLYPLCRNCDVSVMDR